MRRTLIGIMVLLGMSLTGCTNPEPTATEMDECGSSPCIMVVDGRYYFKPVAIRSSLTSIPPCETEDGEPKTPCVWDGAQMGNRHYSGKRFILYTK